MAESISAGRSPVGIDTVLDALFNLENKVSMMYSYFQTLFAYDHDAAELFGRMSGDELQHAGIVKYQMRLMKGRKDLVDIDLSEVEGIIARVDEIVTQPIHLHRALKVSFEIEGSAAEYHYRTAIEQVDKDIASLVMKMGTADEEHFGVLKDFIAGYFNPTVLGRHFASIAEEKKQEKQKGGGAETDMPEALSEEQAARIDAMLDGIRGAGYYRVLGVSEYAGQDEIKEAYGALIREWLPDRSPNAGAGLGEKVTEIISLINEAHETLSDPGNRDAYDRKMRGASRSSLSLIPADQEKSLEAWSQMSSGQYDRAAELFADAIRIDPKAKHYFHYARALKLLGRIGEAASAIGQAMTKTPMNAEYLDEAAEIYEAAGDTKKARRMSEKATVLKVETKAGSLLSPKKKK